MNILAIIVAAVLEFVLGSLWYSKLMFGNQFMKYLGKSEDELEMKPIDLIIPLIASFLIFLFMALLLDFIEALNLESSLLTALIIWIGFIVPSNIYSVIYEGRSLMLYLIFIGYHLVGKLMGALIIGLWI